MEQMHALIGPDKMAVNFIRLAGIPDDLDYGAARGFRLVPLPPDAEYGHGWEWNGTALVPPSVPARPIAEIRTEARARVIEYADQITARITGQYPAAEVASWPTREMEARALSSDPNAAAPLLQAVAAMTGQPLLPLAQGVMAKAAAYRQIVAAVEAVRTQADGLLAAAETQDDVDAALATVKAHADALAVKMGLAP